MSMARSALLFRSRELGLQRRLFANQTAGKPVLEEAGGESKGKNATEAPLSPGSWTGNQRGLLVVAASGVATYGILKFWLSSKKTQADEGYIGGQGSVGPGDHKGQTGKFEPSLNNIGKALQKEATGSLPRFSLSVGTVSQYLRSRTWLIGLAADIGGAVLMLAALALAPVSLVQPVSGLGIVTLAVFSHFHLKERLRGSEWAAVAVAAAGVMVLGASAQDVEGESTAPGALQMLAAMLLLVGTVLGAVMAQLRRTGAAARPVSPRQAASTCGLLAGACFGLSAAASRTGFMLASRGSALWTPAGVLCSVALSGAGVLTQTRGLKDGNSVVVCTCAAVSSMASGVLAGLVALGEALPATLEQRSTRLLAWLLIIAGVGALGAGPGSLAETARALLKTVPIQVWAVLPTWWSVWLQQQASPRADHLPLHGHTETLSKQRSLHRPTRTSQP